MTRSHVIETWAIIKQIPNYEVVAGKLLFTKIFEIAPGAHKLFSFGQGYDVPTDAMYEEEKMVHHFSNLFGMIDAAINLVQKGNMEELVSTLIGLGRRHAKYGVVAAHYPVVGEALLYTIETALGDDVYNDTIQADWSQLWAAITEQMLIGTAQVTGEIEGASAS
jgi:hemoglobin-like flavoprotein